jgi:uncharacterized coiled-coil protein SlyX
MPVRAFSGPSPIPWWVSAILLPIIFLALNGYLVASTTRLEKAVDAQTPMLVRLGNLETRLGHMEKIGEEHQHKLANIWLEQQARSARLALLDAGLKRLEEGQARLDQRTQEIRELLVKIRTP